MQAALHIGALTQRCFYVFSHTNTFTPCSAFAYAFFYTEVILHANSYNAEMHLTCMLFTILFSITHAFFHTHIFFLIHWGTFTQRCFRALKHFYIQIHLHRVSFYTGKLYTHMPKQTEVLLQTTAFTQGGFYLRTFVHRHTVLLHHSRRRTRTWCERVQQTFNFAISCEMDSRCISCERVDTAQTHIAIRPQCMRIDISSEGVASCEHQSTRCPGVRKLRKMKLLGFLRNWSPPASLHRPLYTCIIHHSPAYIDLQVFLQSISRCTMVHQKNICRNTRAYIQLAAHFWEKPVAGSSRIGGVLMVSVRLVSCWISLNISKYCLGGCWCFGVVSGVFWRCSVIFCVFCSCSGGVPVMFWRNTGGVLVVLKERKRQTLLVGLYTGLIWSCDPFCAFNLNWLSTAFSTVAMSMLMECAPCRSCLVAMCAHHSSFAWVGGKGS